VGAISGALPGGVAISALNKVLDSRSAEAIDAASRGEVVKVELLVPYGARACSLKLRRIGGVDRTDTWKAGTRPGLVPRHAARRSSLTPRSAEESDHTADDATRLTLAGYDRLVAGFSAISLTWAVAALESLDAPVAVTNATTSIAAMINAASC